MRKPWLVTLLLLSAWSPALAADGAPQQRIFEDEGPLVGGEVGADGSLLFRMFDAQLRYRVPRQPEAEVERLVTVFRKARDEHLALDVTFDAGGARLDRREGVLILPVCSLKSGDATFEVTPRCPAAEPVDARGETALALALGYKQAGDYEAAARMIEAAGEPDGPAFRKILLSLRGSIRSDQADLAPAGSPEADRLSVAALADYRDLAALAPDESETSYSIAFLLSELGAYEEAEALYDSIVSKWPDESFRVRVAQGAVKRKQGLYPAALEALDRLAASGDRQIAETSMRYRYHRGWTLSLLGRHAEAIEQFTHGLKFQPDYGSAYQRRGCAYAALGRLKDAARDFDRAKELLEALPGGAASPLVRETLAGVEKDRSLVAAALAAGPERPVTDTCTGGAWRRYEAPRSRSPLLPPR